MCDSVYLLSHIVNYCVTEEKIRRHQNKACEYKRYIAFIDRYFFIFEQRKIFLMKFCLVVISIVSIIIKN